MPSNHSVKLNSMPRSLSEYQRKRDFSKTSEPKGAPDASGGNRFVVQKHWAIRLNGVRLTGRYALVRTRSDKEWLLIKKKDEAADPSFDIQHFDTSVKTGRTKEEIEQGQDAVWSSRRDAGGGGLINLANAEKGPMPRTLEPMKAQLVDAAFDDDRWLFEVKWDGIRLVSFIDNGKVSLQTRAGRIVDDEYPQL